jgi:hypothetical protein
MGIGTEEPKTAILRRIREGLGKAQGRAEKLKRTNTRLIYLSLSSSTIATALAGLTAAVGPLAGEGPPAWRLTCAAIAVVTALSGLLSGMHQRMNISDQLARAITCAGRFRALEVALTVTGRDVLQVAKEYEELIANYQEYVV